MSDSIAKAEAVVGELQQKREALVARGVELAEQRSKIAYAAHASGDKQARAELDTINRQLAMQGSETRSLDAAIAEAEIRVERARQAEAQAEARKVARKLAKMADELVGHAQSLDDANLVRIEASKAIRDQLNEMRELAHELGVFVPSHEQFIAMGSRADLTAHMSTPWAREFGEHVAPNQRRNHMSYVASWCDAIRKSANAVLGDGKKTEAA
jgi:chromosome segregation ATPase